MASKKIVCATDFSELSILASHVGAGLAARDGATLVLLYVDPPSELSALGPDFTRLVTKELEEFRRSQDRFVDANLRKLSSDLRSLHDIEVATALTRARPDVGISEVAIREAADLLVLGHHGAGAQRMFFGSVASRVARRTAVPTLVVPEATDPDAGIGNRVLAAVDLVGDRSLAIARAALPLCQAGAKLEMFHAFHEPVIATIGAQLGVESALNRVSMHARQFVGEKLERLSEEMSPDGVEVSFAVEVGSPARSILTRADVFEADLVAVGTHGRRGVERLIGTTAERILRGSEIPVLLVPTE